MGEWIRRIGYVLRRSRRERELADEMEFHREMAERHGGVSFGNNLRLREESRDAWGWVWIDRLLQDVRYAFRKIRRAPGFSLAAILMLALGIGINVAAFGFFDLMVLRPLDVRDPHTLLRFHRRAGAQFAYAVPYAEMSFFRQHARTLSAFIGTHPEKVAVEGGDRPIEAAFATENLFTELGGHTVLGRGFDPAVESAPDATPAVILSEPYWERRFGREPGVLGRTLRLNNKLATIIGVASREFAGLSMNAVDVWIPITQQPYFVANSQLLTDFSIGNSSVMMWGRLRPGATPAAAEQELKALAAELHREHPNEIWDQETLLSEPGAYATSMMRGTGRGTGSGKQSELYIVLGLISTLCVLILAVTCSNLGSLLLARGLARAREISIRVAVGAGSGRLLRQLFVESVVLALLGAFAGVLVGDVVLRWLMSTTGAPAWMRPTADWRVILFAGGMGLFSAVLFGLTPAWQVTRRKASSPLLRQCLIGAQVAGSCVLLIVSGLLVRALNHAATVDPGFDYRQAVNLDPALAGHGFDAGQSRTYLDALRGRLLGLPGVESVSLVQCPPLGRVSVQSGVTVDDGRSLSIQMNSVEPSFFSTMRIPLLQGRNLQRGETGVVVISESLAKAAWPKESALGKSVDIDGPHTVVGVSGNARMNRIQDSDAVEAYFPLKDADLPGVSMVIRASGSPEAVLKSVSQLARTIDPKVIPEVQMTKSLYQQKLQSAEYSAAAVSVLGGLSLVLACLGILGLVSFAVSQKAKEIGIRMALGARPAHVLSNVLWQLAVPVGVGLMLGVGAATAVSRILRGFLYGVSHLDGAAYAAALAVFAVTAALAALLPARRALKVDPLRVLRQD